MKYIGYNSDIINYLTGDLTLLNAIVKNFKKHLVEGEPAISIMFELGYTEADVMLIFTNIFKSSFESIPVAGEYEIDSCKFYHIGSKVYFSLDPDETPEGVNGISEDDNDYILSGRVEGYIFEQNTED